MILCSTTKPSSIWCSPNGWRKFNMIWYILEYIHFPHFPFTFSHVFGCVCATTYYNILFWFSIMFRMYTLSHNQTLLMLTNSRWRHTCDSLVCFVHLIAFFVSCYPDSHYLSWMNLWAPPVSTTPVGYPSTHLKLIYRHEIHCCCVAQEREEVPRDLLVGAWWTPMGQQRQYRQIMVGVTGITLDRAVVRETHSFPLEHTLFTWTRDSFIRTHATHLNTTCCFHLNTFSHLNARYSLN